MINLLDRRRQIRRDRELRLAFQRTFLLDSGEINGNTEPVLAFLRSFCFANLSAIQYGKDGKVDAIAMAAIAGRQEVWQQIYNYLHLSDNELIQLDRWLQQQAERVREPLEA